MNRSSLGAWTVVFVALVALVTVACTAPEPTAPEPAERDSAPPASTPADAVEITVRDFMLDPADVSVDGPTVTFAVTNDGPTPHNVAVRNAAGETLMTTADLRTGESQTISAELEPGDYLIFCSLAGHESLGVRGTLTVGGS